MPLKPPKRDPELHLGYYVIVISWGFRRYIWGSPFDNWLLATQAAEARRQSLNKLWLTNNKRGARPHVAVLQVLETFGCR